MVQRILDFAQMRREGNDLTFRSLMGPGTKNHNAVWQKEARGLVDRPLDSGGGGGGGGGGGVAAFFCSAELHKLVNANSPTPAGFHIFFGTAHSSTPRDLLITI